MRIVGLTPNKCVSVSLFKCSLFGGPASEEALLHLLVKRPPREGRSLFSVVLGGVDSGYFVVQNGRR